MDRTTASDPGFSPSWVAGQRVRQEDLLSGRWRAVITTGRNEYDAQGMIGPRPDLQLLVGLRPAMRFDPNVPLLGEGERAAERVEEVEAALGVDLPEAHERGWFLFLHLEELLSYEAIGSRLPEETAEYFRHVYLEFSTGRISLGEIIRNPTLWPPGEGFITDSSDNPDGAELIYRAPDGSFRLLWERGTPIFTSELPWLHEDGIGGVDWVRHTFDRNGNSNHSRIEEFRNPEQEDAGIGPDGLGHLGRLSDGFPALTEALLAAAAAGGIDQPMLVFSAHSLMPGLLDWLPERCFRISIRDQADWDFLDGMAKVRAGWDKNFDGSDCLVYAVDLGEVRVKPRLDRPRTK
jgi:hypothetical protein